MSILVEIVDIDFSHQQMTITAQNEQNSVLLNCVETQPYGEKVRMRLSREQVKMLVEQLINYV